MEGAAKQADVLKRGPSIQERGGRGFKHLGKSARCSLLGDVEMANEGKSIQAAVKGIGERRREKFRDPWTIDILNPRETTALKEVRQGTVTRKKARRRPLPGKKDNEFCRQRGTASETEIKRTYQGKRLSLMVSSAEIRRATRNGRKRVRAGDAGVHA